jgi:hypothetical protein
VKAVRKAGASDQEIKQSVADAVAARERATQIMQAHALGRLGEVEQGSVSTPLAGATRTQVLVSIGAALGVNCVTNLKKSLAAARPLDFRRTTSRRS